MLTLFPRSEIERVALQYQAHALPDVSWPERHVRGIDGKPVPFHEGQNRAYDSERRIVAVIAGTQSGKTAFGPWWLKREIERCGAGDYLAVTASSDLFKLKMLPEFLTVFEQTLKWGRFWIGDRVFELKDQKTGEYWARKSTDPMWGRIILRSATSPGGLESNTAKAAWLDEAGQDKFRLDSWQAVRRRLSLSRGRVLITTTPYNLGWLKTEIMDKRKGDLSIEVIQFASTMNPLFSLEEFEEARRNLPKWKFNMFYLGEFTRPAGLILGDFDVNKHIVKRFPIPVEWPRFIGVDFGAVNTATLWIAQNPENKNCYIYRETLEGNMTTAEHAAKFLARLAKDMPEPSGSAKNTPRPGRVRIYGGAPSEAQQRWDWAAEGVRIAKPVITDVEAGLDRLVSLIKEDQLYLFDDLPLTKESIATYSREVDPVTGEPTEKIKNKNDFHLIDCARYAAGAIKPKSKVGVVWL